MYIYMHDIDTHGFKRESVLLGVNSLQFITVRSSVPLWQGGHFLFQHFIGQFQTKPHELVHIKSVVCELGMGSSEARVLPLNENSTKKNIARRGKTGKGLLISISPHYYANTSASGQILSFFSQVVYVTPLHVCTCTCTRGPSRTYVHGHVTLTIPQSGQVVVTLWVLRVITGKDNVLIGNSEGQSTHQRTFQRLLPSPAGKGGVSVQTRACP